MRQRESGKRIDIDKAYEIPDGLFPGLQIFLRGRVPWTSKEFSISISDKKVNGDKLLHFNPQLVKGRCVRNSLIGRQWGTEERWQPNFPFNAGKFFTVKIEVANDAFKIAVDGKPFVDFTHKAAFKRGKFLVLSKGAQYYDVVFRSRPTVPLTTKIPDGLKIGKTFRIRGMCSSEQDQFAINFMDDKDNIYFHFNPRPQEKCVFRNAYFGNWGKEEREHGREFPFLPFQYFDSSFVCMEDKFMVFVNGKHLLDFYHRKNPEKISHLNIKGSIYILESECLGSMQTLMEVESGLEKGDIFVMNGMVTEKEDIFAVNFLNGLSMDDDIALHLNPRVQDEDMVLNSKKRGVWQTEETVDLPDTFDDKKPFVIQVEAKKKKFKVSLNGKSLTNYKARGSIEDIKSVYISGKVFIIETLLMKRMPNPGTERLTGIQPGSWITLQGTPRGGFFGWSQFVINFVCDEKETGDIAFHFNVRKSDRQVFRNSRHGSWGKEESDTPFFPFETGDTFELVFFVTREKFMTFVDGKPFIQFNHRLPVERITHMTMDGDCNFYEPEILV